MSEEKDGKKNDGAARTRNWRARKRQEAGGQTQLITWVPREFAEPLRHIFAQLGDPDWPGAQYRHSVAHWLHRRRPAPTRIGGEEYAIEIDRPEIDNDSDRLPAGGRVFGPDGTLIELTANEAAELNRDSKKAVDQVAREFLNARNKEGLQDFTGVLSSSALLEHARAVPADLLERRPETDEQFLSSEMMRFSQVFDLSGEIRIIPVDTGLFEVTFTGTFGLPSRCLAFLGVANDPERGLPDKNVLALIGLPRAGGTPPKLVFLRIVAAIKAAAPFPDAQVDVCLLDVEPDPFTVTPSLLILQMEQDKYDPNRLNSVRIPPLSFGLQRSLREACEIYETWREHGRLTAEEDAIIERLGRGEL